MIPAAAIHEHQVTHGWRRVAQVEQDLMLEAVLHRLAAAGGLERLAFIGGTCLHKLYGSSPQRYSEDLDFVWMGDGAPDDALMKIADHSHSIGFDRVEVVTSAEARFPKALFFYESHDGLPTKMKLDVNAHLAPALRGHVVPRTLATANSWLDAVSVIPCAPLAALAGMKIVAGSTRGKPRDLYDLRYMREELGLSVAAAAAWAQRTRPDGWKPARRHRYIKRTTRKPDYWDDLTDYLHTDTQIQDTDKAAMSTAMLDTLTEIQRRDRSAAAGRPGAPQSPGATRPDAAPTAPEPTRYCGHGDRPCERRVAAGKQCPVHKRPPRGRPVRVAP